MAKKSIPNAAQTRRLTIYDGEKYFDATFSEDERDEIRERIISECGFADRTRGMMKAWDLLRDAETEIMNALDIYPVPVDWQHIHVCKELEIDYRRFAKNEQKRPIEPFYLFVERQFPHFKPARNAMQLDVQTQHIHLAFIDWIDDACPRHGCQKSSHGWGCWDRFEKADYKEAARRIWNHNQGRAKFGPLKLVHSA